MIRIFNTLTGVLVAPDEPIHQASECSPEHSSVVQLAQRSNLSIKAAFVSGCLVLVNKTLASHVVKYWHCFFVSSIGCTLVTTGNGSENSLYHGTHHGSLARIELAGFFCLANAFACLGGISHGLSSGNRSILKSAQHYDVLCASSQRGFA